MAHQLDRAIARVKTLPAEMQDQAARILLAYAGDDQPAMTLTPEDVLDLSEAQDERLRGEFATDVEVEAVLSKYRR